MHHPLPLLRAALSPPPLARPLAPDCVRAGFPSPAQDFVEETLDVNDYLIRNPVATFFVEVEGDSMRDAGILPGDILVVDRSISAVSGHIVVAFIGGERVVKTLRIRGSTGALESANPAYAPMPISDEPEVVIWGVVVGKFKRIPV
jgi:DNA polymerase V